MPKAVNLYACCVEREASLYIYNNSNIIIAIATDNRYLHGLGVFSTAITRDISRVS